jgi:hypothetical protein
MRELDPIRRLAPPVEPLAPGDIARIRARALAPRRRRLSAVGLLAPVAAAAGVALVIVLGGGQDREVPAPAGQALHADGGEAPHLLLGGGWKVTRVDEWEPGSGEMTFLRDGSTLLLNWLPTRHAGPAVGPAKEPGARPELEFGTSDGDRAAVWHSEESGDRVAVWRDGETTFLARGPALSAAELAGLVQSLRDVGLEEWLRAVPQRAVTPPEHADTVDAMLAGLPLPPGLDVAALRSSAATRDRYQLGAQVAGAVVCGWLAVWVEGDAPAAERAVRALASSRDWPVLREMDAEGDYPEVVWQYADAVAGNGTVEAGKTLTVEESYRSALCP